LLTDESIDCPLIRLFGFARSDVELLRESFVALAEGRLNEFPLHEQAWFHAIGGCRFLCRASGFNRGVLIPKPGMPVVVE